jgi:hypothetical protein
MSKKTCIWVGGDRRGSHRPEFWQVILGATALQTKSPHRLREGLFVDRTACNRSIKEVKRITNQRLTHEISY